MDLSTEEKFKIDFPDGNYGHLVFLIGTILTIFHLQVTSMILTKFQVNWHFGSGEVVKNIFSKWRPSCFTIGMILAISDLPVTPMLPTKFRVN